MFKKNLLFIEGLSDKTILGKIFSENKIDAHFFIGHGSSTTFFVKNLKNLFPEEYWTKNCFVLLDADDEGNKIKNDLVSDKELNESNIFTLEDFINFDYNDCKSIEYFYGKDLYQEFLSSKTLIIEGSKQKKKKIGKNLLTKNCQQKKKSLQTNL